MSRSYFISMGPMGQITDKACHVTYLRGDAVIRIRVEVAQVQGTNFGSELLQKLETWKKLPWGAARNKPIFDLIYQHCLPNLEKLAPDDTLQDLSLEAFLHSPTYNLEIISGGVDEPIRIAGQEECLHAPAFFTSPMPILDLPETCKAIPHFSARSIQIAPILDPGASIDSIQGRVITSIRIPMYFKPRAEMREAEFSRELSILSRITSTGLANRLRVPKLLGIVISDANEVIGMLMTMIASSEAGSTLRSPDLQARSDLHAKWEDQLTMIVGELHKHGIVWGDVHPMNVVIDGEMDAWAVDFGGMNNVEFVDDEKRETVEGDWQGLRRVFGEWLPDVERRSGW
jgi:tRNA A-37 threonylcarbamoyl transferase component Bud32